MTDYHDRCEWVNVSLVLAHLDCPGQNPDSRKTVVCVCVEVIMCSISVVFFEIQCSILRDNRL